MSYDVFISHSSKDKETVLRIYESLSHRALKCWISLEHISPGGNYMEEITTAMNSSNVLVLIFSENTNSSEDVKKEIRLADKNKLLIIPLKIDDAEPTGAFDYALSACQWIEFYPDSEKALDTVAAKIKDHNERIGQLENEVLKALEQDGVIEADDQKYVEHDIGVEKLGLTESQSKAIIKRVIKQSIRIPVKDRELYYLNLISEMLEDGKITSLEKRRLAERAKSLGINELRAEALLEQEIYKKGIADIPRSISAPLPGEEKHLNAEEKHTCDDGYKLKSRDTGQLADRHVESHVITDTSGDGNDVDFVDSDEETPWEYFQLGNMTVGQVLDSPDCEELAGYIAFYAVEDEDDIGSVLEQLKKAPPTALIKDVVEDYANFINIDRVGELSVADARSFSLARVIKKIITGLSLDEVQSILDKTHGKTKVCNAFIAYWPDTETDDEIFDDLPSPDYFELGDMKAGEVLAHSEARHLIQRIALFVEKSEQTVRKYLEEANPNKFVKDVVKNYQNILDPDVLASMNISTARDLELGKVIARSFNIKNLDVITKILDTAHGNTLVGTAFSRYLPK